MRDRGREHITKAVQQSTENNKISDREEEGVTEYWGHKKKPHFVPEQQEEVPAQLTIFSRTTSSHTISTRTSSVCDTWRTAFYETIPTGGVFFSLVQIGKAWSWIE